MISRGFAIFLLFMGFATSAHAQLSQDARFEILRTVIAQQAAVRIAVPAGSDGVELNDAGELNSEKITKQIDKDGLAMEPGKVVTITKIDFGNKDLEIELDGGGKKKTSFLDKIQVGVGSKTTPIGGAPDKEPPKGSKIVLKFANKVPSALTPDELRALLDPVLDFNKSNFLKTGVDALPPEFKEAVLAKEARIGMDRNTVLMALGRPDNRVKEKVDGVEQEDWIYRGKGYRTTFVTFEDNVVIRIREHGVPSQ